ncbi:MAG: hypothetical protein DMG12_21315 [Acidobacteria bacterium]|nr:MAG: hypothetical protein DMG12_21315 [Acidobacteriota bacterium]
MKITFSMLLAFLLMAPGCNSSTSTKAASEERDNVRDSLKHQRDEYIQMTRAKLDEFDQKLDGLDQRVSAMKGAAQTDFKNAIARLRDQRKIVADRLADVEKVYVESWTTMKPEVDSALAELERSYDQMGATYEHATAPPAKTRSRQ